MLWITLAQPGIGITWLLSQINELEEVGMSFSTTHIAKIATIHCWFLYKLCERLTVFEWPLGIRWEEHICLEMFHMSLIIQLLSRSFPNFPTKHFFFYLFFCYFETNLFLNIYSCGSLSIGLWDLCGYESYLIYLSSSWYFPLSFFASFLPSKFTNHLC